MTAYVSPKRLSDIFYQTVASTQRWLKEWPSDGVELTTDTLQELVAGASVEGYTLRIDVLAEHVLTGVGYRRYTAASSEIENVAYVEREAAADAALATFHRARANWRRKYNVGRHGESSEARDALDKIRRRFEVARAKAQQIDTPRYAEILTRFTGEFTRRTFSERPRSGLLENGDVLVTWRTLEALGSCGTYVERFRRRFPDGQVITAEVCEQHADTFDWYWAADNLLDNTGGGRRMFRQWETEVNMRLRDSRVEQADVNNRYNTAHAELRRRLDAGELTQAQYTQKVNQLDRQVNERSNAFSVAQTVLHARVFAELYQQHPRPGLTELAF